MINQRPLAERDLPLGHLEIRAAALMREISRPRRSTRRRAIFLAVPIAIAIAATPALAFRQTLLDLFDNGQPISAQSLSGMDRWMLQRTLGAEGRTVQIASDGKIAFYVLTNDAGQYCLASGKPTGTARFAAIGPCLPDPTALLPSDARPIVTNPTISMDPASGATTFISVYGLAADSVVRVAIINAAGDELNSAPVSGHIFELERPSTGTPAALIALDSAGNQLARLSLPAGGTPS